MVERTQTAGGEPAGGGAGEGVPMQSGTGALDQLFGSARVFGSRLRGYDSLQVDAYVAWAESELRTVRREIDDLLVRFGACSAELETSRRLLSDATPGQAGLLQAAVDERTSLAAAAARERDQEAAIAAADLAELRAQVCDLRRQRDQTRQSLRGLSSRIGEALQAVAATAADVTMGANVAIEGMEYDPALVEPSTSGGRSAGSGPGALPEKHAEGEEVVLAGRPAPMHG